MDQSTKGMASMSAVNLLLYPWLYLSGKLKVKNNNYTNIDNGNSSVDNNNSSSATNDSIFYVRVVVIALVSFAILSLFIYINDKLDEDPMPEFQVNSVEVTSMKVYNFSNDYYSIVGNKKYLTANLVFNLTLKNKNEGLLYFNPMQVSLEYHHDEFLSSTMLEPFLLMEDERELQFGMQIKDDARLQNMTVDSISQDLWGQNVLQFALKAKGRWARWQRGALRNCGINLLCDDIKVRFQPSNNLTTGSMIVSPLLCNCKSDCHLV